MNGKGNERILLPRTFIDRKLCPKLLDVGQNNDDDIFNRMLRLFKLTTCGSH